MQMIRVVKCQQHLIFYVSKPSSLRADLIIVLSDFIAPKETNLNDHIGAFAVTTGIGIEEHVKRFEDDHDDYQAIYA